MRVARILRRYPPSPRPESFQITYPTSDSWSFKDTSIVVQTNVVPLLVEGGDLPTPVEVRAVEPNEISVLRKGSGRG